MPTRTRFKPWMLVAAIWIWPAVLNVVNRVVQGRLQGWDPATLDELLFGAGDWLLYALVTPVIFWVSGRWPLVRPHVARRAAIHVAWALAFCVVWAVGGKLLELALASAFAPARVLAAISEAGNDLNRVIAVNVASWILSTLPFGAVVYVTVAGMAHAFAYFNEARDRELQVARLAEQLTGARYAALQAQLNPHFLFNTLNTVTVLVRDGDRAGAVRIVEQLSDILRRTLSRHRAAEVTLGEELELVDTYLAIERSRFPDRLRAEVQVDRSLAGAAVPSFALQHLVENAIRHGVARREQGGRVTVGARRDDGVLEVTVADDGPGLGVAAAAGFAAGHGIANTRERLAALHGDRASLEVVDAPGGGVLATLRVPYRAISVEAPDAGR